MPTYLRLIMLTWCISSAVLAGDYIALESTPKTSKKLPKPSWWQTDNLFEALWDPSQLSSKRAAKIIKALKKKADPQELLGTKGANNIGVLFSDFTTEEAASIVTSWLDSPLSNLALINQQVGYFKSQQPYAFGSTILCAAIDFGHIKSALLLLKAGADTDQLCGNNGSALHVAVKSRNIVMIKSLIEAGASLSIVDKDGLTPLHLAVNCGFDDIVDILLAARAELNTSKNDGATPLIDAIIKKRLNIATALIAAKADVNQPRRGGGGTPLYAAAYLNRPEIAQKLLEAGADPNAGHSEGISPLHKAASSGHISIVKLLLKATGIKIDQAAPHNNSTPIMVAALNGHLEVVQLLLDHNADVNLALAGGATLVNIFEKKENPVVRMRIFEQIKSRVK